MWWRVFGVVLCCGCAAGGQTGEETFEPCRQHAVLSLALDDVSALGFSAREVLTFAEGEHTARVQFYPSERFPYRPTEANGLVRLNVTSLGQARFIDLEPRGDGPELYCADRLEIPVRVQFSTEGGAFDEAFESRLVSEFADAARLEHAFDLETLRGSFRFEPEAFSEHRLHRFGASVVFEAEGTSGRLDAAFEHSAGTSPDSSVSLQQVNIARWSPEVPSL
jgi:hypothetical protein